MHEVCKQFLTKLQHEIVKLNWNTFTGQKKKRLKFIYNFRVNHTTLQTQASYPVLNIINSKACYPEK